ncbi:MAG: glycoside hydrolase family 25, partial [Lachnospiraceae bacterium]|nr:glycoside hydrolase family 25 [Lachnospiraceae bacterium]
MLAAGLFFLLKKRHLSLAEGMALCYRWKGMDVSHYQGEIDWKHLKAQGISFAYIKATEGSGLSDAYFAQNFENAEKNGVVTGAYHFFSFDSDAKTQAQNYIRAVGDLSGHLIPAIDVEYYGSYI